MLLDRRGGSELFYVDESGRRRDGELHEEILSQGDDGPGLEVSTKIKEGMLAKARRYLPAEPVNKPQETKKDAWDPNQPREPAGTSEGGQFAGGSGGGSVKIEGVSKYFKQSKDVADHKLRVAKVIQKAAARNNNYRIEVRSYILEAKALATHHPEHAAELHAHTAALKTKIGESFWQQGATVLKKGGDAATAEALMQKGIEHGYQPPAGQAVEKPTAPPPAPKTAATIPVAKPDWKKVGPQEGSVPGGLHVTPTGGKWYVKTPKSEDHVNADLLSNALYKMAGVSVSDEVKTVLAGQSAVASKFIEGTKTLAQSSLGEEAAAHVELRKDFAIDAWLGNRDVIGQGFDNVLVSEHGLTVHRIDQGGTLMYRAQGEVKPFGPAVDEITSMRSTNINPQTALVFGMMSDQEVSASIDKVLAIPDSHIKNAATAHGMASVGDTLIARKQWLAEYQKTLDVPAKTGVGEPQEAWMTAMEAKFKAEAAQPKPTAAELEKAKKVGPYYPAPTSEMGKVAVKHFNEKWATKSPEPHELEEKVADYKNAKAAVEVIQKEEAEQLTKAAAETKKQQAAATKAAKAAAVAKEQAEKAAYQEHIAKIAADIGLSAHDAEQVDALISLAGGNPQTIIQQFKTFNETGKGKHGLPISPFESAMIQSYVGSAYGAANRALREGAWDVKTHAFAKGVQSALAKLPPYNETLKRGFGLSVSEQKKYEEGKIVRWDAFSSCGKSSSFGGNMQCTVTPLPGSNTRARDLGQMNPNEAGGEVLFMAHSSFKVTKVQGSPGGEMKVWLEEVEAFH